MKVRKGIMFFLLSFLLIGCSSTQEFDSKDHAMKIMESYNKEAKTESHVISSAEFKETKKVDRYTIQVFQQVETLVSIGEVGTLTIEFIYEDDTFLGVYSYGDNTLMQIINEFYFYAYQIPEFEFDTFQVSVKNGMIIGEYYVQEKFIELDNLLVAKEFYILKMSEYEHIIENLT